MKAYYSEGGAPNPHFQHKVKIHVALNEMMDWLQDHISLEDCRYWIDWQYVFNYTEPNLDNEYEFTFESHKDATMFALRWAQ